jgi:transposase
MMTRIRASLREKGCSPTSRQSANCRSKLYFSTWLYRQRNLVERFFSAEALPPRCHRYDKLAENFRHGPTRLNAAVAPCL